MARSTTLPPTTLPATNAPATTPRATGPSPSARVDYVVVGAGQIGRPLAAALARSGPVRLASRRGGTSAPGVDAVAVDARDAAALAAAADGARAIVVCANPTTYDADAWARELPPLVDGAIAAAAATGARLVVLENLYLYRLDAGPLAPDTPVGPATKKGAVRAQLAATLQRAHDDGRIRAAAVRPSDFWGPGLTSALLSDDVVRGVVAGRGPHVPGDVDAVHAWSYRDDVVDLLARLATGPDDDLGRAWHAPVIHASPRAMVAAFAQAAGTTATVRSVPTWLLRALGVASPTLRGLVEMLPQWSAPYLVDDAATRARFGVAPTSLDDGVQATIASLAATTLRAA